MDPSSWANLTHYAAAQSRFRGAGSGTVPGGGPGGTVPGQNHCHQNQMSTYTANQMQSWLALSHPHHHHPGLNPSVNQGNNPGEHAAFGSTPFGLPAPPPPHPGVASYDASGFLSNPFQSAKAGYLPTPSGFFKAMTAKDANDMSNLRAAGFPPPQSYCSGMQGALHPTAMGHPDTTGMTAATATGASLFPHHLPPGSLRHHPNLMSSHNHGASATGPFGILPHEAVNVMNTGTGHHPSGASITSHPSSSSGHSNKSCSVESNKHHHHHHHKNNSPGSSSFGGMMPTMSQNVHSSSSRSAGRSFDHQLSKQLAHHHHPHQPDPYFSNFLMSQENYAASQYAAAAAANMRVASNPHMLGISSSGVVTSRAPNHSQYSSMNFPNSLARDFMGVGSSAHSVKHSSNNSCHNQARTNLNSAITGNNHLGSCNMMMTGLSANSYSPSPALASSNIIGNNASNAGVTNHGSNSRSSSAASNHALQQGSESSSCSFGYNSPSTNLPHSPYQQRTSVSVTPVGASSQTPTSATASASVGNGVQDFAGNTYPNQPNTFSSMGTPAPSSTPAYPTPPSSVNQQVAPQSQPGTNSGQEDSMGHFPSNSQNNGNAYPNNFNSSPYSTSKLPTNNGPSVTGSVATNSSSCMVAAAAAAAASNSNSSNNSTVSYLHSSLRDPTSLSETDPEACLSNIVNVTPISDAMSDGSKLNDSQINSSGPVDVNVIGNETTLNAVFSGSEIEFSNINFPPVEETAANYAQSMRIDNHPGTNIASKKKKDKTKKHKKKDKNKSIERISLNAPNSFTPFQYQSSSQYHENYANNLDQNCSSYLMHQAQATQQQPIQSQTNLLPTSNVSGVPQCFDAGPINLQPDLINNPLSNQLNANDTQDSSQVNLEYSKSHSETSSQQLVPHPSETNDSQLPPETESRIASDKFASLEDDLSFLTEATNECDGPQNHSNEIGTQAGSIIVSESHSLTIENSSVIATSAECNLTASVSCSINNSTLATSCTGNSINNAEAKTDGMVYQKGFNNSYLMETKKDSPSSVFPGTNDVDNCTDKANENCIMKKKKHKDSKMKLNGQKVSKSSTKRPEPLNDSSVDIVEIRPDQLNKTFTTIKPYEMANVRKSGEMRDHEGKFFKMRPASNSMSTSITSLNLIPSRNFKGHHKNTNKKRKLEEKNEKSAIDEYEFPDSPNPMTTKKSKKSNSENPKKKTIDKLGTSNSSLTLKKTSCSVKNKSNSLGNAALSKLNLNEKSDLIKIGRINNQQLNCNKIESDEQKFVQKQQITALPKQYELSLKSIKEQSKYQPPSAKQIESVQPIREASHTRPNSSNGMKKQSTTCVTQGKKEPFVPAATFETKTSTITVTSKSPTITTKVPVTTVTVTAAGMTITTTTTKSNLSASQNSKTTQSVSMQSAGTNTPRRRSQDKKALTIREGLMRTGDFVVSLDETNCELPMIWRIEGKSLLQRFEPSEQEGSIVYINTSSYSAWNPTVRQRYTGVDVRIMGCNRTKIVVEKLGLTKTNSNNKNGEAAVERGKPAATNSSSNFQHQADFQVFIQTLISQALDPNFITEIIKENDEYFISHLQAIDDYCIRKKSRFFSKVRWDANIVKCVETFAAFNIIPQTQVGDLRCRLCHDNWSTQILHFIGEPYDQVTLETKEPVDIKQTKYAACDQCKEKITLFSHLHHQKFNFFSKCRDKVEEMRCDDEYKESEGTKILAECLKDTEWMQSLFKQFEEIWQSCDRIR